MSWLSGQHRVIRIIQQQRLTSSSSLLPFGSSSSVLIVGAAAGVAGEGATTDDPPIGRLSVGGEERGGMKGVGGDDGTVVDADEAEARDGVKEGKHCGGRKDAAAAATAAVAAAASSASELQAAAPIEEKDSWLRWFGGPVAAGGETAGRVTIGGVTAAPDKALLLKLGEAASATVEGGMDAPKVGTRAKPPSNLAALSRSQTGLLPGTTPSRRRWHSSHGHLPCGGISIRQPAWACNPQLGHLLLSQPIVPVPGTRLSSRQMAHHCWFPRFWFTEPFFLREG